MMDFKYEGYLCLFKIKTKYHQTFYANAFVESEAIEKVKSFIMRTPLYEKLGEKCFEELEVLGSEYLSFVLI